MDKYNKHETDIWLLFLIISWMPEVQQYAEKAQNLLQV